MPRLEPLTPKPTTEERKEIVTQIQAATLKKNGFNMKYYKLILFSVSLFFGSLSPAGEFATKANKKVQPSFDIIRTKISTEGNVATFEIEVSGKAGQDKPKKSGKFAGARVFSYVWPTSIDPAEVGFEEKAGLLALAVTIHPDFNDTPLFDNNGAKWHTHWVVLTPDDACGAKGMKVKDIAEGTKPKLPKTWPGVPLYIDSPGYPPHFSGKGVQVKVPFDHIAAVESAKFDGVTSGLRVNESIHTPLLCIENIFKVASGELSLPGQVSKETKP